MESRTTPTHQRSPFTSESFSFVVPRRDKATCRSNCPCFRHIIVASDIRSAQSVFQRRIAGSQCFLRLIRVRYCSCLRSTAGDNCSGIRGCKSRQGLFCSLTSHNPHLLARFPGDHDAASGILPRLSAIHSLPRDPLHLVLGRTMERTPLSRVLTVLTGLSVLKCGITWFSVHFFFVAGSAAIAVLTHRPESVNHVPSLAYGSGGVSAV